MSRSVTRSTSSVTLRPILSPVSARTRSSAPAMGSPSSATIMSPALSPARPAAEFGLDRAHDHGALLRQPEGAAAALRDRGLLRGDADEGAAHAAVPDQFAEHEACGIGGDREADALRAHDDGGVDADDFAARGDQRPAGIAGIERGIGLDHVVDQPAVARAQRAAERGDDAGRHGGFEAERIADGDHQLAALELFGIAERRRRQASPPRRRAAAPDRYRDRRRRAAPAIPGRRPW